MPRRERLTRPLAVRAASGGAGTGPGPRTSPGGNGAGCDSAPLLAAPLDPGPMPAATAPTRSGTGGSPPADCEARTGGWSSTGMLEVSRLPGSPTVAVIAGFTVLELVLIYALSIRLSRPIEGVSRQLRSMETLSFESPPAHESKARVREIAQLQDAAARVRASLR